MQHKIHNGKSHLLLIVILAFLVTSGIGLQVLISGAHATTRDVQRLEDMRNLESAFAQLYLAEGSYTSAAHDGCGNVGDLVGSCNFTIINWMPSTLKDPGKFSYAISVVPSATTYGVTFTLERSHDKLSSGKHTLTPEGIR